MYIFCSMNTFQILFNFSVFCCNFSIPYLLYCHFSCFNHFNLVVMILILYCLLICGFCLVNIFWCFIDYFFIYFGYYTFFFLYYLSLCFSKLFIYSHFMYSFCSMNTFQILFNLSVFCCNFSISNLLYCHFSCFNHLNLVVMILIFYCLIICIFCLMNTLFILFN